MTVAKRIGCQRFIGAGSIMEYEVEDMYKIKAQTCGVDLIWGVITNAYGEGEISQRFINTTIKKMLRGEELKFTSATQNYDFIHVRDLCGSFLCNNGRWKTF